MNKAELQAFFRFVRGRQRVWWRKEVRQKPPPYSKDPILQTHWFTNMYRELDPGTVYAANIYASTAQVKDAAFWLLFYRHIASNRHSMFKIRTVATSRYDPERVRAALESVDSPFGRAYNVWPFTNKPTGGKPKTQLVADAFGDIAEDWDRTWELIQGCSEPEQYHEMIMSARNGIGPFVAYQAWIDYCMLGLIPDMRNEWCIAGPGAVRGASIIWGQSLSQRQARGAIYQLWWEDMHDHIDYAEPWWLDHPLYMSDIQNCLCEFQKYVRVRDGGRPTRGYDAEARYAT